MKNKVCVIGLGYIGLPTASFLAASGCDVLGVDVNSKVVENLIMGKTLIYEPGLDKVVKEAVSAGKLKASLKAEEAAVFILAVPTPFKDGKKPDLKYVEAATRSMAPVLKPGNIIILESTSPVGSTEKICVWIHEMRPDLNVPGFPAANVAEEQIYIAHCPERVLPGRILQELVENDRIIGGADEASTTKTAAFYRNFVKGEVLESTSRVAELTKLTENSYRDVNIAFANELSIICSKLDIDVWEVIKLANHHPRVNILRPGVGVGGHCIAVDPWFIVDSAPEEARLISTARKVNDDKPFWAIERIKAAAKRFKAPKIALLGLAFKADIDDLRESPACFLARKMAESCDIEFLAVEPHIETLPGDLAKHHNLRQASLEEALKEADVLAFLVPHSCFKAIPDTLLREKQVLDLCGLFK